MADKTNQELIAELRLSPFVPYTAADFAKMTDSKLRQILVCVELTHDEIALFEAEWHKRGM